VEAFDLGFEYIPIFGDSPFVHATAAHPVTSATAATATTSIDYNITLTKVEAVEEIVHGMDPFESI
jgi:hypothetical protein